MIKLTTKGTVEGVGVTDDRKEGFVVISIGNGEITYKCTIEAAQAFGFLLYKEVTLAVYSE
jgi:hypothetical protein